MAQKSKNRVYKLKESKIKKLIRDFGFAPQQVVFENSEGVNYAQIQDEILIKTIELDRESDAVKQLVDILNNPGWQKNIDAKGIEQLEKNGIVFEDVYSDVSGETRREARFSESAWHDLCEWQLCIEGRDMLLFLTKKDLPYSYYNTGILDNLVGPFVQELLNQKIIKKVPAPGEDDTPMITRAS